MTSQGEFQPLASHLTWTELLCQCLPTHRLRSLFTSHTSSASAQDIEMQDYNSSQRPRANNPVVPAQVVTANNPDNVTRPSRDQWWTRHYDDLAAARTEAEQLSRRSPPPHLTPQTQQSDRNTKPEAGPSGTHIPPSFYNRTTSTPAPQGLQELQQTPETAAESGMSRREGKQPVPPSPTGSVNSIDFFGPGPSKPGFGQKPPSRPQRFVGTSPYAA